MAMPKKRMSPVRSANRRRQIGLSLPATVACPACGGTMAKHLPCPACGSYRGRAVLAAKAPQSKRS